MRLFAWAAGGTVALFLGGLLVYVLGSFALMYRHNEQRALGLTVREVGREIWLGIATQPLLPLYYLVGRRLPLFRRASKPGDVPVVFVHGYMQNRVGFVALARALDRRGLGPLYAINYPWFLDVGSNARRLSRFVAKVCAETKAPLVDLVCHSMGGLVAMEMLGGEAAKNELHVRKCITIATPHAGVTWRGPMIGLGASMLRKGSKLLSAQAGYKLAIPTLSLYSTHDNVVFPMTTAQLATRGGTDIAVDGLGHLSILFAPVVAERVASFLAEPVQPAVIVPPDGDLPRTSPAEGKALAEVTASTAADVESVVRRARIAQAAWAELPVAKRVKAVSGIKNAILRRAEEIATAIHDETGKPDAEALLGEVLASADVVAYWADLVADELEPFEAEIDALSYPKKSGWVHREARGVIALVMPWNFPFALPLRTIVPALMAGNAVVFKPSEIAPRTGKLIASLFDGLVPEGLFGVVQGGGDVGAALVEADIDSVVFTGSTATGKKVAHACAERLLPCVLELGGKDAAIVLADADLDRAANGIVWGAMMNAGQNCGAVERVYVVTSVAAKLTEKVVAATKALRYGEDVGPLTTAAQKAIVARHVAAAKADGGEILAGGEEVLGAALGFQPTVVRIDKDDTALVADETFGPVVPLTEVADAAEAIRRANASRYGLTASIWSADIAAAEKLAHRLKAGVVTINNHSFTGAIPSVPWGGVGESGWGFTGSPLALDHVTRPRLVVVDRNRAPRETWWYPYSPTLKKMALAFAKLRGGASSFGDRVGALLALLGLLPKRMGELKAGKPAAES